MERLVERGSKDIAKQRGQIPLKERQNFKCKENPLCSEGWRSQNQAPLDKKRNPAGWKSTQVNPFSAYEKGEKQSGSTNHKKALKKMKSPPSAESHGKCESHKNNTWVGAVLPGKVRRCSDEKRYVKRTRKFWNKTKPYPGITPKTKECIMGVFTRKQDQRWRRSG